MCRFAAVFVFFCDKFSSSTQIVCFNCQRPDGIFMSIYEQLMLRSDARSDVCQCGVVALERILFQKNLDTISLAKNNFPQSIAHAGYTHYRVEIVRIRRLR